MPTIDQELSNKAHKIYKKLKAEHGEEYVLEHLLTALGSAKPAKQAPAMAKSPDTISMLNDTIAAMKSLNESYARENERLLKIVNFSEHDEKINGLKAEIADLAKTVEELKGELKATKEISSNFETKALDLEVEKEEITATLESSKKEVSSLVEKVAAAEGSKAQLDATVTSYVEELRRYKEKIEEMKNGSHMAAEKQDSEAPAYS